MYLLDTKVVTRRTQPQPDERVRAWLRAHRVGDTYLSVITLAELEQGILRLGDARRGTALREFLSGVEGSSRAAFCPSTGQWPTPGQP